MWTQGTASGHINLLDNGVLDCVDTLSFNPVVVSNYIDETGDYLITSAWTAGDPDSVWTLTTPGGNTSGGLGTGPTGSPIPGCMTIGSSGGDVTFTWNGNPGGFPGASTYPCFPSQICCPP